MRLCQRAVFSYLSQALADRRIVGVVDIDISTRAWVRRFNTLIAITLFLLRKCNLNSFFLEKTALNIIAFFLINKVLLGAGVGEVSLLGERSVELILPKVTSLGRAEERINVLVASGRSARTELGITYRVTELAELTGSRLWEHVGIVAWSRLLRILSLSVFTIRYFRAEDAGIALRAKILLLFCCFRLVVNAGAWVLSWRELLVLDINRRLKELPYLL